MRPTGRTSGRNGTRSLRKRRYVRVTFAKGGRSGLPARNGRSRRDQDRRRSRHIRSVIRRLIRIYLIPRTHVVKRPQSERRRRHQGRILCGTVSLAHRQMGARVMVYSRGTRGHNVQTSVGNHYRHKYGSSRSKLRILFPISLSYRPSNTMPPNPRGVRRVNACHHGRHSTYVSTMIVPNLSRNGRRRGKRRLGRRAPSNSVNVLLGSHRRPFNTSNHGRSLWARRRRRINVNVRLYPRGRHRHRYHVNRNHKSRVSKRRLQYGDQRFFPIIRVTKPLARHVKKSTGTYGRRGVPTSKTYGIRFTRIFRLGGVKDMKRYSRQGSGVRRYLRHARYYVRARKLFRSSLRFMDFSNLFLFRPTIPRRVQVRHFCGVPVLPYAGPTYRGKTNVSLGLPFHFNAHLLRGDVVLTMFRRGFSTPRHVSNPYEPMRRQFVYGRFASALPYLRLYRFSYEMVPIHRQIVISVMVMGHLISTNGFFYLSSAFYGGRHVLAGFRIDVRRGILYGHATMGHAPTRYVYLPTIPIVSSSQRGASFLHLVTLHLHSPNHTRGVRAMTVDGLHANLVRRSFRPLCTLNIR